MNQKPPEFPTKPPDETSALWNAYAHKKRTHSKLRNSALAIFALLLLGILLIGLYIVFFA
jgi:hypothetical protein